MAILVYIVFSFIENKTFLFGLRVVGTGANEVASDQRRQGFKFYRFQFMINEIKVGQVKRVTEKDNLLKIFLLLIFCITIDKRGYSQQFPLDKIESSLDRIIHTTAFPCNWKLQRTSKVSGLVYLNGSPLFVRDDSTRYEIEMFNTKKLPFYNVKQTSIETSNAFFKWDKDQLKSQKEIVLTRISPNQTDPFVIFKIQDKFQEYYCLIMTVNNVTYSIKIQSKNKPFEKQLEELKLLGSVNLNN